MIKSRLQEYTQKNPLPLPVYGTSNDGNVYLLQFKCNVTVNGYDSQQGFKHRKEAENAAVQAAIEDLVRHGLVPWFGERGQLKHILDGLATKKNIPLSTYQFTKEGETRSPIFTTVEIDGASYTGVPGNNKKEVAGNAACEAIRSIRIQDCELHVKQFGQFASKIPIRFPSLNFRLKIKETSLYPRCQLLVGTDSHSVENSTEKLNVENAPALERVPVKINVEDPCAVGEDLEKLTVKNSGEVENGKPNINAANAGSAPVEQSKQNSIMVKQHRLKEEMRGLYQDKDRGSTELEGKGQSNQDVLTEPIGKRSRSEDENAEQISERKKKLKRKNKFKKKIDGTA